MPVAYINGVLRAGAASIVALVSIAFATVLVFSIFVYIHIGRECYLGLGLVSSACTDLINALVWQNSDALQV